MKNTPQIYELFNIIHIIRGYGPIVFNLFLEYHAPNLELFAYPVREAAGYLHH
jgi:hypothetical protein